MQTVTSAAYYKSSGSNCPTGFRLVCRTERPPPPPPLPLPQGIIHRYNASSWKSGSEWTDAVGKVPAVKLGASTTKVIGKANYVRSPGVENENTFDYVEGGTDDKWSFPPRLLGDDWTVVSVTRYKPEMSSVKNQGVILTGEHYATKIGHSKGMYGVSQQAGEWVSGSPSNIVNVQKNREWVLQITMDREVWTRTSSKGWTHHKLDPAKEDEGTKIIKGGIAEAHIAPRFSVACDIGKTMGKEACREVNKLLAVQHGKKPGGDIVTGSWGHIPKGCSSQIQGDWTAHYNESQKLTSNTDGYALICEAPLNQPRVRRMINGESLALNMVTKRHTDVAQPDRATSDWNLADLIYWNRRLADTNELNAVKAYLDATYGATTPWAWAVTTQTLEVTLQNLQNQFAHLQPEIEKAVGERKEKLTDLSASIQAAEETLQLRRADIVNLQSQITDATTELSNAETLLAVAQTKEAAATTAAADATAAEARLNAAKTENASAEAIAARLRQNTKELEGQIAALEGEAVIATGETMKALEVLKHELQTQKKVNAAMDAQVAAARQAAAAKVAAASEARKARMPYFVLGALLVLIIIVFAIRKLRRPSAPPPRGLLLSREPIVLP